MMIMNPLTGGSLANLFSTHPSTEERVGQVKSRLTSLVGGGTDPNGGVDSYEPGTLTLGQRVTRLFDDARDGDPASLGIVTAAGLALAGLSVTATVAAVKVFRARAGRA